MEDKMVLKVEEDVGTKDELEVGKRGRGDRKGGEFESRKGGEKRRLERRKGGEKRRGRGGKKRKEKEGTGREEARGQYGYRRR